MSYGLEVRDASGGLVASQSAPSLHYIGEATFNRTTAAGVLVYRVTSLGGPPLPFIEASAGSSFWLKTVAVSDIGGGVYEVSIISQAGQATRVHCFAPLPASAGPAEPFGLRVLSSTGSPNFDSTRQPLVLDKVLRMTAQTINWGQMDNAPQWRTAEAYPFTYPASRLGVLARGAGFGEWDYYTGQPHSHWAGGVRLLSTSVERGTTLQMTLIGGPDQPTYGGWSSKEELVYFIDLSKYGNQ